LQHQFSQAIRLRNHKYVTHHNLATRQKVSEVFAFLRQIFSLRDPAGEAEWDAREMLVTWDPV
jgi:hypothetical protein